MFRFFESICIVNSIPQRLELHQQRMHETMKKFYKNYESIDLNSIIATLNFDSSKIYKLRIDYSNTIEKINLENYIEKTHQTFRLVEIHQNIFEYKFQDRTKLTQYLENPKEEILFVLNNYITDTTYSNLVFKKNMQWFISKSYLLNGTQRKYLIQKNQVKQKDITVNNLKEFESFKLINSMLDLESSREYLMNQIL